MRILQGQNYRESWWATNNTQKVITISDLLTVPEFDPGKRLDLLRYCSREKVHNSKILELLVRRGWITLLKKNEDFDAIEVTEVNISEALSPVERDTAVTGSGGSSTLDGLTDVITTSPEEGDVLRYNGSNWVNEEDTQIDPLTITETDLSNPFYYGGTLSSGDWKINRWVDGVKTSSTQDNNPSVTNLTAAWAARASLNYT